MEICLLQLLIIFAVISSALSSVNLKKRETCLQFSLGATIHPGDIPLNESLLAYSLGNDYGKRTYVTFENITSEELMDYKEKTKDLLDDILTSNIKFRMIVSNKKKRATIPGITLDIILSFFGNSGAAVALPGLEMLRFSKADGYIPFIIPYQFRWLGDNLGIMSCHDKLLTIVSQIELKTKDLEEVARKIQPSCNGCMSTGSTPIPIHTTVIQRQIEYGQSNGNSVTYETTTGVLSVMMLFCLFLFLVVFLNSNNLVTRKISGWYSRKNGYSQINGAIHDESVS